MQQIGKYAIVGQIGTGGFGVVFEGHDPFLKRRVAIKTCTSEEPEIRDRFFREAEIAGNLRHRNIVTVHDFGIQDGVPYLVQEYLTGEDLDRLVARREPLAAARRVEILVQAARGLEYAHSRGVIHRDVKPGNIRLTTEGVVKIMDFGIAKLANVASHLTRTGMTVGTAAYLPPEQIRGTAVDHRADVFSFGVTAYELLAYRRPFGGKTISALFWDLLQRDPPPLSEHWPECPPRLEALVLRCLAKDAADRHPGFDVVVAELLEVLAEMRRNEAPTAPHRMVEPPAPPAPAPASPPGGRAPRRSFGLAKGGRRVAARDPRRETGGGLLGDVEEALTTAHLAAGARRVRELLAAGEVDAAERELRALPPGGEVEVLARQVERAVCDQLLAQAAASWGQGDPESALAQVDQLLARAPGHQDAHRLRDAWQAEHQTRERQRQTALAAAESRRHALTAAVHRVEEPLARGELDAADAALSAAIADLGSHQPLRDLRRRLVAARGQAPSPPARPSARLLDQSTVGIDAARMAIARERAAAERARAARGPGAWSPAVPGGAWEPGSIGGPATDGTEPPGAGSSSPPPVRSHVADGSAGSRRERLTLVLGAVVLLALLLLGLWWVSRDPAAAPPAAPLPTASPALGIGGAADG